MAGDKDKAVDETVDEKSAEREFVETTPLEDEKPAKFTAEQKRAIADGVPDWAVGAPGESVAQTEFENWTVGEWGGMPNYICNYCLYATVEGVDVIEAHYDARHSATALGGIGVPSGLVDGQGNPISAGGFR